MTCNYIVHKYQCAMYIILQNVAPFIQNHSYACAHAGCIQNVPPKVVVIVSADMFVIRNYTVN